MHTDGTKEHDLFRSHIKHILDTGIPVVVFIKIGLIYAINVFSNCFPFIK